ncbi:AAA family ATPase [Archangium sp.]|uniref:AAA family ATPase n=1 Tax=Archangium sp. TaxID=1872627 RepID=UPI00286D2207|nr:AAA family ATPase [Archangium sp.]
MITEIEVKNFKTLRDVRIPLAPGITVMVGANNSGKSNALAVLKLLRESLRQKDPALAVDALGGFESLLSRNATGSAIEVTVTAESEGVRTRYKLKLPHPMSGPKAEKVLEPTGDGVSYFQLFSSMHGTTVHDLSVAALRAPALVQQGATLGPDGRDIAAVLDNLAGENPSLRDAIDEMVRGSAREVKRIVTRSGAEPGTKVLGAEEKDGRVYGAEDMSDGLLLFIGLAVAAQLKRTPFGILAIEEPERGIHPRRLRDLIDNLLRLTKSGTQVVLTTHSPTLLDEFRDTPESVLIFDRDDTGTHVTRLSDRKDWAEELQKGVPLGDLWYSGVLGGVPGR